MRGFQIGDPVEILDAIAALYDAKIGIILAAEARAINVIKEFTVKLADGIAGNFYDFQLRILTGTMARRVFDSASSGTPSGIRGTIGDRHLRFVEQEVDIHIKIAGRGGFPTIIGQLFVVENAPKYAMATLVFEGKNRETVVIDRSGEFQFTDVPAGDIRIDFLVPSRRILAPFEISAWKSTA
jgi:hypothetical protein